MLVCESMDACIFVCMVVKSFIYRSSRLIPSVEFSPTNSSEDKGKLFVHSNPLEQVHIVYTSVTKPSLVERLVLFLLLCAMDGNVVAVRGHRNVIMCKIADRPLSLMQDEDRAESCDPSLKSEPEPRLEGPDENTRFTPPINFFILHSTCNNNTQQEVTSTLGVSVSVSRTGGWKQRVV
jgi:hypothetical protein